MAGDHYPRVASFRSSHALVEHLSKLGWRVPADEEILTSAFSPLAQPIEIPWHGGRRRVGNRFAVQPMEGWDGDADGNPSDLTRRRWQRFARSGAKLIWGGEAIAVLHEARANPNQLVLNESTVAGFEVLLREVFDVHRELFGRTDDLVFGLQLTHSGRFSRPHQKNLLEPIVAYRHPVLDERFHVPERLEPVSDAEIARIVAAFARAARLARDAGFDFVDLKQCHGYLGHEFLSAFHRPGPYGGSFENRTRFLCELIAAVRDEAPGIEIGVRLSVYDSIPFAKDAETGRGFPAEGFCPYTWGFGMERMRPTHPDLSEAAALLKMLSSRGVHLVNITASSPYYAPHLSRPALFPPCDGYLPPEDPLDGAARLISAARELKASIPGMVTVSTGWTYFQNYLPQIAQATVREGWTDFVGLGRMMLSYPELPADVLTKGRLDHKRICRTFSDCTNGPRNGMISGCYPLDPFYKARPEAQELKSLKAKQTLVPAEVADET